jgi:hypothetical protein
MSSPLQEEKPVMGYHADELGDVVPEKAIRQADVSRLPIGGLYMTEEEKKMVSLLTCDEPRLTIKASQGKLEDGSVHLALLRDALPLQWSRSEQSRQRRYCQLPC